MSLSRKKALLLWSDGVEIGVKKNGAERPASIEDFHNPSNEFFIMEFGGEVKECPLKAKDTGEMRTDPEAIEYLDQCIKNEPDTKDMNTHKGEYFPYRKELHSKIIRSFLDHAACVKQTKPIAVFMGGAPGSGKTTFLQKNAPYLASDKIFKIDADAIRAQLPEYNGWNAWATQNETRDIINRMIEIVGQECLYDFVFDGTMTSPGRYISMIKKAQSLGYETFVIFVDVPREISEQRALERFKTTGRYVAKIVFDEFYAPDGARKSLEQIKGLVDGYVIVDGVNNYNVLERGGDRLPEHRPYEKVFNGEKKKIIVKRANGGTIPTDVSEVVKKYGWGIEPIAGTKNLQLISRKGNPAVVIEMHGAKYKILDGPGGNKLMSGRGMLAKSIETLLTKYYYAQPVMAKGGSVQAYPDLSKIQNPADIVINDPGLDKNKRKGIVNEIDIVRLGVEKFEQETKITGSNIAASIFYSIFQEESLSIQENLYCLFLSRSNEVISYWHASKGGVTGTIMDVEMIASVALKTLASGVVIAHNHPSGNLTPSVQDILISNRVKDALSLFNIKLLDSLIIIPGGKESNNKYYSLADSGDLSGEKMEDGGEVQDKETLDAIKLLEDRVPALVNEKGILTIEYAYRTNTDFIFNMKSRSEYPVNRASQKMKRMGWKVERTGHIGERLLLIPNKTIDELIAKMKLNDGHFADGGITIGPSHADGGIKFNVGDSGQVVELEGDEGVLKKSAMQDQKEYTLTGSPRTIASCLNEMHGGKNFRNSGKKCIVIKKKP